MIPEQENNIFDSIRKLLNLQNAKCKMQEVRGEKNQLERKLPTRDFRKCEYISRVCPLF